MANTTRLLTAATVLLAAAATTASAGVFGDPTTFEQVRRYLGHHAADVAVVTFTVNPDGTPSASDPSIFHNADAPMPLASTIKVVLLAGWAREVVAGHLDPEQLVTLADWERFFIPATDGGAHLAALAALGIAADEYGFAADPNTEVPLRSLVWAMIAHSDNAAADWVLERIGDAGWADTVSEGGLEGQDPQLPITGQVLAWANHERPALTAAEIAAYQKDPLSFAAETHRLAAAYQDPAWRAAELAWRLAGKDPSTVWSESKLADTLAPRGTARDYARMMGGIITGTFIAPEVSSLMREPLEWPMADPGLAQVFSAFGIKGGSLAAVLNDAAYGVPLVSDFVGKPRVCVLLMRRMPILSWLSMSMTGANQQLEFGLLGSRSYTEKVRASLPPAR